jgi:hypothetical protein
MKSCFLYLSFLLFLSACEKPAKEDDSLRQYNVLSVTGPSAAAVNQTVSLTVTYRYTNGCQVVDTFKQERSGHLITVRAYGHYDVAAVCTQDVGTRTKTFDFSSANAGTFELRFTNIDNSFVTHTVTVN